jgi:hypothetical protein
VVVGRRDGGDDGDSVESVDGTFVGFALIVGLSVGVTDGVIEGYLELEEG